MEDETEQIARFRLTPSFAFQIVAWIVAALLTYGAMSSRLAVVETRQGESDRRMERIENKLDVLIQRVK